MCTALCLFPCLFPYQTVQIVFHILVIKMYLHAISFGKPCEMTLQVSVISKHTVAHMRRLALLKAHNGL